jgi:hypothetical protein
MKKSFHLFRCLLLIVALSLFTCERHERVDPTTSGSLLLEIELPDSGFSDGRIAANDKLSIVITVVNESGETILDQEVLELRKLTKGYFTEPISLVAGSYDITDFSVINKLNEAIYMTPKSGSPLAYLVDNPVPISFFVASNLTTKLAPEVISTERKSPKDFGYSSFAFNHVETFDFLIAIFAFDANNDNYVLTQATLQVEADGVLVFDSTLYAGTVKITLPANYNYYTLFVSKPSYYGQNSWLYTQDELEQHFSEEDHGPLLMYLTSQPLWEHTYDMVKGSGEFIGTSDGGFIIIGTSTNSFPQLIKLSRYGFVEWQKIYESLENIRGTAIAQTNDGGYIFTGNYLWPHIKNGGTCKINKTGDIEWTNTMLGGDDIIQDRDLEYLIVHNKFVSKLGQEGDILWTTEIDNTFRGGCLIQEVSIEGDIVVGGMARDTIEVLEKIAAAKIDVNGEILWFNSYGKNDYQISFTSVAHDGKNGFLFAGNSGLISNIDGDGSLIFMHKLRPDIEGASAYLFPGVITPSSNGFIVGTTIFHDLNSHIYWEPNVWIVEINHQGLQLRDKLIERKGFYYINGLVQSNDGDFVVGGNIYTSADETDANPWVLKDIFEN